MTGNSEKRDRMREHLNTIKKSPPNDNNIRIINTPKNILKIPSQSGLKKADTLLNMSIRVNERCNLSCHYCFDQSDKSKYPNVNLSEDLVPFIKENARGGNIWFSGGEPLLARNFISVLADLTNYGITCGFNTNLTLNNIRQLIAECDMNYVIVHPALHYEQLESKGIESRWLENYKILKNSNPLELEVVCIAYPGISNSDLARYEEYYRGAGVVYNHTPFMGKYGEVNYPEGYTQEDIQKFNLSPEKLKVYQHTNSCTGIKCPAGSKHISVKMDGEIYPCIDLSRDSKFRMGNISDGTLSIYEEDITCPASVCGCPIHSF